MLGNRQRLIFSWRPLIAGAHRSRAVDLIEPGLEHPGRELLTGLIDLQADREEAALYQLILIDTRPELSDPLGSPVAEDKIGGTLPHGCKCLVDVVDKHRDRRCNPG